MIDLAVVIVSFNTKDLTRKCLEDVFSYLPKKGVRVVVVDNNSQDGSVEMIKKHFPQAELLQNSGNLGFGKANNQGIKRVDAGYYLLLNSDTQITEDVFSKLIKVAQHHNFGILSPKILNQDLSLQPNFGDLPLPGAVFCWLSGIDDLGKRVSLNFCKKSFHLSSPKDYKGTKEVGWVAGTAMLISRETIDKIGLFDENIFMYAEDVDFCWRAAQAGLAVGFSSESSVVHLGGGSSKNPKIAQWRGEFGGLVYLYRKFYGFLPALALRVFIIVFILLRMLAFGFNGKFSYTKAYAKVLLDF